MITNYQKLISLLVLALMLVSLPGIVVAGDTPWEKQAAGIAEGNNNSSNGTEEANGIFKPPSWARTNIEGLRADAKTIAQNDAGKALSAIEVSSYFSQKAKEFIDEYFQR